MHSWHGGNALACKASGPGFESRQGLSFKAFYTPVNETWEKRDLLNLGQGESTMYLGINWAASSSFGRPI